MFSFFAVANGGYSVHMDDEDEGGPLSHGFDSQPPYLQERCVRIFLCDVSVSRLSGEQFNLDYHRVLT